jgi:hypothetical protein
VTSIPYFQQDIHHADQKINKETSELDDSIHKLDFKDIYRILQPTPPQYIAVHETFSKIDHILRPKEVLTNAIKFNSMCFIRP